MHPGPWRTAASPVPLHLTRGLRCFPRHHRYKHRSGKSRACFSWPDGPWWSFQALMTPGRISGTPLFLCPFSFETKRKKNRRRTLWKIKCVFNLIPILLKLMDRLLRLRHRFWILKVGGKFQRFTCLLSKETSCLLCLGRCWVGAHATDCRRVCTECNINSFLLNAT